MSRGLYRLMAQARGSLNNIRRGMPRLTAEQMALVNNKIAADEAAFDAHLQREQRRHHVQPLIEHPVIDRKDGTRFRVVRLYRREHHLCYEDIGGCLTVEAATEIMKREQWRAQVFSQLDQICADNWRAMERR